jgi:hypothetical protein
MLYNPHLHCFSSILQFSLAYTELNSFRKNVNWKIFEKREEKGSSCFVMLDVSGFVLKLPGIPRIVELGVE